jgi:hypothetical protein
MATYNKFQPFVEALAEKAHNLGSDQLIAWFDYGSSITLANGETLDIDFDGTNGLLQLA